MITNVKQGRACLRAIRLQSLDHKVETLPKFFGVSKFFKKNNVYSMKAKKTNPMTHPRRLQLDGIPNGRWHPKIKKAVEIRGEVAKLWQISLISATSASLTIAEVAEQLV